MAAGGVESHSPSSRVWSRVQPEHNAPSRPETAIKMRIPLQQVTLVAVDTDVPMLAGEALLRSMAHIDFGRVILFTSDWLPPRVIPGLEVVEIGPLREPADRSTFLVRQLPHYIRSSHVLLAQWDAFVARPAAWGNDFLTFDYVGAVWPDQPEGRNVGAGGFSLRSRRLLAAGLDSRLAAFHPDDEVLCRVERERLERELGVSFAPPALAQRFAAGAEAGNGNSFGFCGAQHLPDVLDEATLQRWMALLPDAFFRSAAARRLAKALLLRRMPAAARQLLARLDSLGEHALDTKLLGAATSIMGLLGPR